ncbi:probable E3 SUMO-protein ligase RNF212 isoform X2 [Odocoileus virginianus]|uniref:Probable E3 SUMO-protein ligase RNF212 n=1 Tax=Odocoileus virginianus TaxID=9874 RepID=A0A6J0Y1I3_ODOVR|nr:probable E3 SUMO-protein ligase RNF212 isoform X2 [Odocoileus virginianus texanus]
MASWVFCNRCFQPPQATSCFSLTNCGHVYCDVCLRKGKRDECLICKVACRTILLSKHTDSDIQALFMGIDSLCRKYAKETSQILHPVKKMGNLACHSQDSAQPDKYVNEQLSLPRNLRISRKAQEETVSLLRRKGLSVGGVSQEVDAAGGAAAEGEVTTSSFQHSKNSSFHGLCFLVTAPSARPNGPLFQSRDSSASERVESMEVDLTPSPRRKPEVIAGPPRISLLSPPRDGRMGSIAHRPQHLGLTPRCSSEPQSLRIPALQMPCEWPRQSPAPAAGRGAAPRQPISISGLMQRQHPGPASLGGLVHE